MMVESFADDLSAAVRHALETTHATAECISIRVWLSALAMMPPRAMPTSEPNGFLRAMARLGPKKL